MTPTVKESGGSLSAGAAGHTTQATADPFILTLCRLAAPVTIPPPQAPHLKPFTFFTSRSPQPDGSERLHLHMGFFATLKQAEKWAQLIRGAYPHAIATRAPAELLRKRDSAVPTLPPADVARRRPVSAFQDRMPTDDRSLTDTQVFRILETRRVTPDGTAENNSAQISLLRPDDTDTWRVLKAAVVQGAPVSFAVQLHWSVQPIDLTRLPSHSSFRAYALYVSEGRRDERSWYSLRLGFFSDAISAKQVAYYLRPSFASVAVVPISEEERTRANESLIDPSTLSAPPQPPDPLQQSINRALDSERHRPNPAPAVSARPVVDRAVQTSSSRPSPCSTTGSAATHKRPPVAAGRTETLEQTLELLAGSELFQ
jgi:hypothetical protein